MIRTQIQFTEAQLRRVRAVARRQGVSVAEVVRAAVDRALGEAQPVREERWQRMLAAAGGFRDREGCGDVGASHDRFLDEAFES